MSAQHAPRRTQGTRPDRARTALRDLRLPADQFYWALLEAPGWSRRGELPASLRLLLAEEVPAPIDILHAVGLPMGDGIHVLACAMPRELLGALETDVAALTPAELPSFAMIDAAQPDPRALNLLVGTAEPRQLRVARHHRHALGAAALLACALLVSVGLHRRAEHDQAIAHSAAQQLALLAPPPSAGAASSSADGWGTSGSLDTELTKLRSLQRAAALAVPASDAGPSLAAVLSAWPSDTAATAHSITVHDSGATLVVSVADDPAVFIGALKLPDGWSMREPKLNRVHDLTRINLELARPEASAGSSGERSMRGPRAASAVSDVDAVSIAPQGSAEAAP